MLGRYLGGGRGCGVAVPPGGGDVPTPPYAQGTAGRWSPCPLCRELCPRAWLSPAGGCVARLSGQGQDFVVAPRRVPLRAGQGCHPRASHASPHAAEPAGLLLAGKGVRRRAPSPQLPGLRRCLVSQPRHRFLPPAARPAANPPGPKDKQGRKQKGVLSSGEAPGMCRCGSPAHRLHNPSSTAAGTCSGPRRDSAPHCGTGRPGAAPLSVVGNGVP